MISVLPNGLQNRLAALPPRARSVVQDVALKTLMELAISIAVAAICLPFMAPSAIIWLGAGLLLQTGATLFFRSWIGYNEYHHRFLPKWANYAAPAIFARYTALNGHILIHEAGHALATKALFSDSRFAITLYPYSGGNTSFSVTKLSAFGRWVGERNLYPIIAAAGPVLSLAFSAITLVAGLYLQAHSPEVSRVCVVASLYNFADHARYALSALWANPANFTHDFVALWTLGGLHPLIVAVAICAIPIILYLAFQGNQKK